MRLKKNQLKKSRLYVIFDRKILKKRDLVSLAKSVIRGGADIIQLRDKISEDSKILKEAKKLRLITKDRGILFIVNDRPDLVKACDADGVHLGREDLPIKLARRILGKNSIIGLTCRNLKDVLIAKRSNVDYISIGPVFKTPLKPELKPLDLYSFKDLEEKISIPVFAIGGINYKNLKKILKTGINRIAICRGILLSKNISEETKRVKSILTVKTQNNR